MANKLVAAIAALSFALASTAPGAAFAYDRGRGHHDRYERHHSSDHHGRRHHDDDDGDAIAAGIIGLALGALIVGAAMSGTDDDARCSDAYGDCAPRDDRAYDDDYGQAPYDEGDYAPPAAQGAPACVRQVRQYDPHTDSYVWVNLRTAC